MAQNSEMYVQDNVEEEKDDRPKKEKKKNNIVVSGSYSKINNDIGVVTGRGTKPNTFQHKQLHYLIFLSNFFILLHLITQKQSAKVTVSMRWSVF